MPTSSLPRVSVVLTCEHAGNLVPSPLRPLFASADDVLNSHRGWDPGALPLARRFARTLSVPLQHSKVSRLVVELNRSLGHPRLFSEFTSILHPTEQQALIQKYWTPHRDSVQQTIAAGVDNGQIVVHLSVHTFTQFFNSEVRTTEIGLLYDPRRSHERTLCALWREKLIEANPAWTIRRNDPYKGSDDGLTTSMRKLFGPQQYLGIELEVCQKYFLNGGPAWQQILTQVPRAFKDVLTNFQDTVSSSHSSRPVAGRAGSGKIHSAQGMSAKEKRLPPTPKKKG